MSDEILKHARKLISDMGEDLAFQSTCIAMESAAFRGDQADMERHAQVLLAMCGMLGRQGSTVH